MATARQKAKRNKALRHSRPREINPDDLTPGLSAGLTQGPEALREADERFKPVGKSTVELVRHMREADRRLERGQRQYAQFVASNSTDAVWQDGVTDRLQMDYTKTYTEEGMRFLREGRQCLRCDEPHSDNPFPLACDVCGYAMKERQIMDIAMEFEGTKHLGPRQPISEFMERQEARVEKRKFIKRVLDGGQGKIPAAWLRDAELLDGLHPSDRAAIGAHAS